MAQILIIDDDPYVRRFYEHLFKLNRYDIDIAGSGEEGIRKAKVLKPQLILLDIMMPKMNGLEVLKILKEDPQTSSAKVIVLSNLEGNSVAGRAAVLGASGFIIKSQVTDAELLSAIDSHLTAKK